MKKHFTDFLIAITVIVCSLVLLGALTYALSGRFGSKSERTLDIDYPDVTGIKLHSSVRYAGAPAGTVTKIRLLSFAEREAGETPEQKKNAVRVTVTLLKEMPPLPSDIRASLAAETLLSEKFVALSAGSPSVPKLANGVVLQGHSGGGLDGLFDAVGPLMEQLPQLLRTADEMLHTGHEVLLELKPLPRKMDDALGSLKTVVTDVGPRANKLLDGLKATSDSADLAIKNVNKLVDGPNSAMATDLDELKNTLQKMQTTLGSVNQVLARTDKNLDARMAELGTVLQNLKVATTHAKALTQTIGERPNRLIFGGKPNKLPTEEEILRSTKPLPGIKP